MSPSETMSSTSPQSTLLESVTLDIDQNLMELSIQEGHQILLNYLSSRSLPEETRAVLHSIGLRLSYYLMRSPCPTISRDQALALNRYHQSALAQRLDRLQDQRRDLASQLIR